MTNTDPTSERRHFRRVHFEAPAVLSQQDKQTAVEILDLSLKGVLVENFDSSIFDLDRPLQLELTLSDNVGIAMELSCAHQRSQEDRGDTLTCGFRCNSIDLESVGHLRRLVELNLGSHEALDRDLSELMGLH